MSKHGRNPLPPDTEELEPEGDAPAPADIGLGAPVGDAAALARAVQNADAVAHGATPPGPDDIVAASSGPRQMTRAAFIAKYGRPSNIRARPDDGRVGNLAGNRP